MFIYLCGGEREREREREKERETEIPRSRLRRETDGAACNVRCCGLDALKSKLIGWFLFSLSYNLKTFKRRVSRHFKK